MSIATFADDVAKKHLGNTGAEAVGSSIVAATILDEKLSEFGFKQNRDKKEASLQAAGKGRNDHMRKFYGNDYPDLTGKRKKTCRHLGPLLTCDLTVKAERESRITAIRKAYFSMGRFWTSKAPLRVKKMVFQA